MALLAIVGCAICGFSALFVRLCGLFQDPLEDMSFGWLVPIFSLYVLWSERKALRANVCAPSWGGVAASIPFALLALVGTRGLQMRFEQVGFIGLCVTLPWAFFGWRFAKCCLFPALYLAFTIPLASFLDVVTIHLRLLASSTALCVLKGFGFNVMQQGTSIVAEGAHPFSIDVAEPCSGLRSLFALMALTAAYAWYNQPTWWRRLALFACSIPLAILGNVTRVLTICLVAAWANPKFALGFYHDYSGYVVFVVAISLMVAAGELITRIAEKTSGNKAPQQTGEAPASIETMVNDGPWSKRVLLPVVAAALLCPIFIFQMMTPDSTVAEAPAAVLPTKLGTFRVEDVGICQNEQCGRMSLISSLPEGKKNVCPACGGALAGASLGERTILPNDTVVYKRLFFSPRGDEYLVSMVIGGKSKRSIHRPELCLPAQGFLMGDPRDFTVGATGRPFHAVRLQRPNMQPATFAYTFFNQAGVRTSSHIRRILVDTWDRSVLNRVDRWVMVTVMAQNERTGRGFVLDYPSDRQALEEFLSSLMENLP